MKTTIKSITNIARPGEAAKFKVTVEVFTDAHIVVQSEIRGEYTERQLLDVIGLTPNQIIRLTEQNN